MLGKNLIKAAAGNVGVAGEYQISRSLRFNSADSAYLSRTPASAGNRKTWTWSGWVKRSEVSSGQDCLFSTGTGGNNYIVIWYRNDVGGQLQIQEYNSAVNFEIHTTAVYRDTSAWFHIVFAFDSTQATNTNRMKLYINGELYSGSTVALTWPSQNYDGLINTTNPHSIGRNQPYANGYHRGYMAEVNFIDGQALTPSSFGEVNATTGVWSPIAYTGTYGTNGFYLDFSDNTSTTTLGYDAAGSNDWTLNNFSVTAGAGNDSLVDSPTRYGTDTGAGGEVRGNYCTLNPLYGSPAPTNGNLDVSLSTQTVYGSFSFTSGKWYFEVTPTTSVTFGYVGVMDSTYLKTDGNWSSQSRSYSNDGSKYNGSNTSYGATWTTNDVIGVAVDMDAGTIAFYKNGSIQGTAFTDLSGKEWRPMVYASSASFVCNFGQRSFAYTAPSGFKALCTTNLPDPTVVQGDDHFNTVLWTGDNTPRSITGVGFQPDFVWIKNRSSAFWHQLYDAVRGVGQVLYSNTTEPDTTVGSIGVTAFNSDGFSIGNTNDGINGNGNAIVAWNWNAGGSNATNTDGTITSTVRANPTAGFSIVSYTGNGSAGATVGHGLGVAPSMIIIKGRSTSLNWIIYHAGIGNTKFVDFTTAAAETNVIAWNDTSPTSTVFTLGTATRANENNATQIAYCFAEVPGFSAFGSYTGNGSADGPFVYTGFRPRYLLFKRSSSSGANWGIYDSARDEYNVVTGLLRANTSDAEATLANSVDFLSNGFKWRTSSIGLNESGSTYIYAAFAENPFKYSLAR